MTGPEADAHRPARQPTRRPSGGPTRRPARRPNRGWRLGVQVFGELLMTAGVIALLFVGWELWWTNVQANATQQQAVQQFFRHVPDTTGRGHGADGTVGESGDPDRAPGPRMPVTEKPSYGATIGVMYIPRLGDEYSRPIVQGTSRPLLDTLGLGHYGSTAMPGAKGNFAVAGHRQTHGAVLDHIDALRPGDRIYVQTRQAYYTYVFRNNQIVLPNRTDVLAPVPTRPDAEPTQSMLTMTSCNPRFGSAERIIAYAVLESWRPVAAGPPQAIAETVADLQEGA